MLRRSFAAIPIAVVMLLTAMLPASVIAAAPSLREVVVQDGLIHPWDVAFAPGGQMFVTERPGRVRVYRSGKKDAPLLRTNTISNVQAVGEAGVMGIAVDPKFQENRYIYVCASRNTNGNWRNQVLRYHVKAGWGLEFDRYVIRRGMRANTIHNGCAVEFGPDGKLWVSMGDASDPALAQDPDALNGKILRVNRGGSVPSDNPILPGSSGRSVVYSMGHRNPQGIAFHPASGGVYAVEHGPDRADEINWIRAGRNYGWPCVTGDNSSYQPGTPGCGQNGPFTKPAWHSGSVTIATSGAAFARGADWESYRNQLFVAQLKQQDLRRFKIVDDGRTAVRRQTYYDGRWGRLRGVVSGPGKRLWITTSNGSNDKIVKIAPS